MDLRKLLLERLEDEATMERVVNAVLAGLDKSDIKPGDAMKIYDFLSGVLEKEKDAGTLPDASNNVDFSNYSDEELREMLRRLENGAEPEPPRATPTFQTFGKLSLRDFLNG